MEAKEIRRVIKEKTESEKPTSIVIGGGLVGAMCVCMLAQRGYKVTMYEKRADLRKTPSMRGRSINLALSHRGRKALRMVGLETMILEAAIPMKGRLLHSKSGNTTPVLYDPVNKQCIYSVGRNYLNQLLLDAAEKYEYVTLLFRHKLERVNFKDNTLVVLSEKTNDTVNVTADFIVGADGAFSSMRSFMQKCSLYNFSQSYIEHGYMELTIPADRGHKLHQNYLHIWPRGSFMMIALPNQDSSWTVTLFMPFEKFRSLSSPAEVLKFFSETFPDSLNLIGHKKLISIYFKTSPAPLLSVKCSQYHMGDRFLIIGDAAHAMVPFYGQGMNAGFEDCTYLNDILEEARDNIKCTIETFTKIRRDDAHSICDLALYNYTEMRDLVTTRSFKLRKTVDRILLNIMPETWIPLYSSISFSHMKYQKCIRNKQWQDKVLKTALTITIGLFAAVLMSILVAFRD